MAAMLDFIEDKAMKSVYRSQPDINTSSLMSHKTQEETLTEPPVTQKCH